MNVSELLEVLSSDGYRAIYTYAKATNTCLICKKPATHFRDASIRMEYTVSALCEECQYEILHQKEVVQ